MDPRQIGMITLSLAIGIAFIYAALLTAGVLDQQTSDIFTTMNVSSTWTDLRSSATNYAVQAFKLALIGLVFIGIAILLAVIFMFARQPATV